mgnify:CR=1 FL=1|jgi:hypothetical protein|tara:strand:+ start:283 stop:468 length:186 start_codon:yes stop_codon:yes gene_type:complete
MYVAVLALGGNEMGPRSNGEIIAIFTLLVGLIILNAIVFGEITVLIEQGSTKSTYYQNQVD